MKSCKNFVGWLVILLILSMGTLNGCTPQEGATAGAFFGGLIGGAVGGGFGGNALANAMVLNAYYHNYAMIPVAYQSYYVQVGRQWILRDGYYLNAGALYGPNGPVQGGNAPTAAAGDDGKAAAGGINHNIINVYGGKLQMDGSTKAVEKEQTDKSTGKRIHNSKKQ